MVGYIVLIDQMIRFTLYADLNVLLNVKAGYSKFKDIYTWFQNDKGIYNQ
jgi:hypothetical protein